MAGVVTNTSPVIALDQIGQLWLLKSLFGEVFAPPAVAAEAVPSVPELPSWIVLRPLSQNRRVFGSPAGVGPRRNRGVGTGTGDQSGADPPRRSGRPSPCRRLGHSGRRHDGNSAARHAGRLPSGGRTAR